jgi:hypothetical protein
MVPLVRQVMKPARTRIVRGNTRGEGKLVSLFEPSTEIIRKGKASKPPEFGKMVKLQEAENQIITDYEVYAQRPSDSVPAIDRHQALLGRVPRLVAADAAFYSARNEAAAKAKGVKRVCIPNRSTKSPPNGEMASAVAATRDLLECSAGSASASSAIPLSTSAALWKRRQCRNRLLAPIILLSPPVTPAGFAFTRRS